MYISYRTIEEARNEAVSDAHTLGPLLYQALKEGSDGVTLNTDAGHYFLEDDGHTYRIYLDTLVARLPDTFWEIRHVNGLVKVLLKFSQRDRSEIEYKKAA